MKRSPIHTWMRRHRDLGLYRGVVAAAAALALLTGSAVAGTARTAPAGASSTPSSHTTEPIVAKDYDLGVRTFPQPGLNGRFAKMPIRLWGTIAAPAAAGPHPIVLIAHGAHGDNCPVEGGEFDTWPCWKVEQRNDLGFRYLVRALARAGFVAIAMDTNAAYTGGWGELPNKEKLRFGQVLDATLAELTRANAVAQTRFAIPLQGRLDLTRVGMLGHSRGGMNILRWGNAKRPQAVFLVAPFFDAAQRLPDAPSTVVLGTCDFDTGRAGAGYVTAAAKRPRTTPVFQLTLSGANHNYYNQTLVALRKDDADSQKGRCAKPNRLTGPAQQAFLARVVTDHFGSWMLDAPPAAWITGPVQGSLYGQKVAIKRVTP